MCIRDRDYIVQSVEFYKDKHKINGDVWCIEDALEWTHENCYDFKRIDMSKTMIKFTINKDAKRLKEKGYKISIEELDNNIHKFMSTKNKIFDSTMLTIT